MGGKNWSTGRKSYSNAAQCNLLQTDSQKTNSIRSFELLNPAVIWEAGGVLNLSESS